MLVHLPRLEGWETAPRGVDRVKNGPALAGYGAETMRDALTATVTTMPQQLRRSLTWDRGKELAQHAAFTVETGVQVYSPTLTARGSAAPTRTPTACYVSTSPRGPTWPAGTGRTCRPSPTPSTADPARPSDGRPQPKPRMSYCPSHKQTVLLTTG